MQLLVNTLSGGRLHSAHLIGDKCHDQSWLTGRALCADWHPHGGKPETVLLLLDAWHGNPCCCFYPKCKWILESTSLTSIIQRVETKYLLKVLYCCVKVCMNRQCVQMKASHINLDGRRGWFTFDESLETSFWSWKYCYPQKPITRCVHTLHESQYELFLWLCDKQKWFGNRNGGIMNGDSWTIHEKKCPALWTWKKDLGINKGIIAFLLFIIIHQFVFCL